MTHDFTNAVREFDLQQQRKTTAHVHIELAIPLDDPDDAVRSKLSAALIRLSGFDKKRVEMGHEENGVFYETYDLEGVPAKVVYWRTNG